MTPSSPLKQPNADPQITLPPRCPAQDPLGVPKINSDDASSPGGVKPEPPGPTTQPARSISSTSRADKDALYLSKPVKPLVAPDCSASGSDAVVGGPVPMEGATPAAGGVRRVSTVNMTDTVRQLFVASPAYPSGVRGVMTSSRSTGAGASPPSHNSSLGREAGKHIFRMVFDKTLPVTPGRGAGMAEMELPVGLEAVCDERGGGLSIRELLTATGPGGAETEGAGGIIARIEALPSVGAAEEAVYCAILDQDGGAGEMMAVRVSKHPTKLSMPREVRAVLLLPPHREDSDGRSSAEGKSE